MFLTGVVAGRERKAKPCSVQERQSKGLVFSGFSGMYLSKGCRCEVVLCFWFFCYFLLAASQVTDPTEGIFPSLLSFICIPRFAFFSQ